MLLKSIGILIIGMVFGAFTCLCITEIINLAKFNDYIKVTFQNRTTQAVKSTEISYDESNISGPSLDAGESEIMVFSEHSRFGIEFSIKAVLADGRTLTFTKLSTHNGEEWEMDIYPDHISPGKNRTTW
jgi:hypothetical protein